MSFPEVSDPAHPSDGFLATVTQNKKLPEVAYFLLPAVLMGQGIMSVLLSPKCSHDFLAAPVSSSNINISFFFLPSFTFKFSSETRPCYEVAVEEFRGPWIHLCDSPLVLEIII